MKKRLGILIFALAFSAVLAVPSVAQARNVLVFTGAVPSSMGVGDSIDFYARGKYFYGQSAPIGFKATFKIPNTSVPAGVYLYGAKFYNVPDGPARIRVRPLYGGERNYYVTIGSGPTIPWWANWQYRGWEAYWCGP